MSDVIHKYPSQEADRFQVRMPEGLRDKLREAAAANGRSMNAEIVKRLEDTFEIDARLNQQLYEDPKLMRAVVAVLAKLKEEDGDE